MKPAIAALACALALSGCAGIQNPFAGGKFNAAVWRADLAVIKANIAKGREAIRDTMDALCPVVGEASAIANDPNNQAIAQSYLGSASAVQKAVNNANDGLTLLADVCRGGSATDARTALLAGAQALNDIKRIFGR